MMSRFQLCCGPSGSRAHIRDRKLKSLLTLCEATAPASDIVGTVAASSLCKKCLRVMFSRLVWVWDTRSECLRTTDGNIVSVTPELIGVEEIR